MLLYKNLNNKQTGGSVCATPTTMCYDSTKVLTKTEYIEDLEYVQFNRIPMFKLYLKVIYDIVDFS